MSIFEVNDLVKDYGKFNSRTTAIKDISLRIEENEILSIIGASGSGKTTLMNMLSTIDKPTDGEIYYNGKRIDCLSERKTRKIRLNEFGFVFQKYYLIDNLNVYDNICLPYALNRKKLDKSYVDELLEVLDIKDKKYNGSSELSGGEQQRVAIARALVAKPKVLFADEPTGNLDSVNGRNVIQLLLECSKKYGQTVIYVTHDENLASMADRTICLKDGVLLNE